MYEANQIPPEAFEAIVRKRFAGLVRLRSVRLIDWSLRLLGFGLPFAFERRDAPVDGMRDIPICGLGTGVCASFGDPLRFNVAKDDTHTFEHL